MRSLLKRQKKADLTSLIIGLVVIIAVMAMIAVVMSDSLIEMMDALKDSGEFSNNTISTINTVQTKTIPMFDFLIFFAFFAVAIGLIISSIYLDVHPAITVAFIIGLIIAVLLSAQFVNVYGELSDQEDISSSAAQFTLTNVIMGQYGPIFILVIGVIVIVIIYGKSRRVGEV